jgi:hypothetical protein
MIRHSLNFTIIIPFGADKDAYGMFQTIEILSSPSFSYESMRRGVVLVTANIHVFISVPSIFKARSYFSMLHCGGLSDIGNQLYRQLPVNKVNTTIK